ncbi:hypothetical protein SESBI_07951 [Sesbania bispinosa]|nr:hypothetical protein SESBI_07951 [Sesbania bispinosa]
MATFYTLHSFDIISGMHRLSMKRLATYIATCKLWSLDAMVLQRTAATMKLRTVVVLQTAMTPSPPTTCVQTMKPSVGGCNPARETILCFHNS